MSRTRIAALVTFVCLLFAYGGIRSADGEVLYRTAESLAVDRNFSIAPLEQWPGFGIAVGADGGYYGKYGPALPVLATPLVRLGIGLDAAAGWLSTVGPSHYSGDGYPALRDGRAPVPPEPHVRRSVASLFNVAVAALAALAFLRVLERLGVGRVGAAIGAVAFALGTPMLPYSATFFTEPLVTMCLLATIGGLVGCDPAFGGAGFRAGPVVVAGLWMGLALAAHVTAGIWLPFLAAYVGVSVFTRSGSLARAGAGVAAFSAGSVVAVGGLLLFNAVRFGSVLETGRPDLDFAFVAPWRHALPLLLSWGKGLFVYCPLALVGLASWRLLARRHRVLGWLLMAGLVARMVFFASFHDWHGGYGPGPRYLLPEIAVSSLAAGLFLERLLAGRAAQVWSAAVLVGACVAEQVWIASGEIFAWSQRWRAIGAGQGSDVFAGDLLYRAFDLSPFAPAYGHDLAGPALARLMGFSPVGWAVTVGSLVCGVVVFAIVRGARTSGPRPS